MVRRALESMSTGHELQGHQYRSVQQRVFFTQRLQSQAGQENVRRSEEIILQTFCVEIDVYGQLHDSANDLERNL